MRDGTHSFLFYVGLEHMYKRDLDDKNIDIRSKPVIRTLLPYPTQTQVLVLGTMTRASLL